MNAVLTSNMTSKGQVTIPAALRQSFGFKAGAAVEFFQAGSYVGVRPVQNSMQAPKSGFGMINYDRGLCTGAAVLARSDA